MLSTFTFTAPGGHAPNEDAFAVDSRSDAPDLLICAVADGQGGQANGGPAARRAVQECVEQAQRAPLRSLLLPATWGWIVGGADRAVRDDRGAGYTTLVGLATDGRFVCGASVGDSSAVLALRGKPLVVLTDNQEKNPPVGSGAARPTPFAAATPSPFTLVLMTDGVWKYTRWERALSGPSLTGDRLIEKLLAEAKLPRSGRLQDDFTLMVVQNPPPAAAGS